MADPPPSIFTYLDHRKFLKDWFEWKKRCNPRFSHRVFARLAGQKNPSLLHQVIQRQRNLTENTLPSFMDAVGLDTDERDFFVLLVQLDAATTPDERNASWERISATARFQASRRIEGQAFLYLTNWYIPAVRELATCPGFRPDPGWIARTLRPQVSRAEAEQALSTLLELGMLRQGADGSVEVVDTTLTTPHEVTGLAVHNYHRGMLGRALDAIEAFRAAERHLGGVTVAIPSKNVDQLKRELSAFQERVLDLCERAEGSRDRVFQVSLQLFPLSARLTAEDDG